ncbi:MAG: AtpZ/AtpI family protein [Thermomicrobiales bacterium]
MDKNPLGSQTQRDWRMAGAASGIGCTVVISLLICIGGGIFLDRWLGIEPVGVLTGVALGLAAAGYSLYELTVLGDSDRGIVTIKKRTGDDKSGEAETTDLNRR